MSIVRLPSLRVRIMVSVTAAAVAAFVLLYVLFSKLFPTVSMWETRDLVADSHAKGVRG